MDFSVFINYFAISSIVYFFMVNSIYLILLLLAVYALVKKARTDTIRDLVRDRKGTFAPPISILAPAYNEQETIVDSVRSFMLLNYPKFEVIVVNDGSKDQTLQRLKDTFKLEETKLPYDSRLSSTKVRAVYRSHWHPNLIVVDKENGGKADALNVGMGFSENEIFCTVDSDSLLEGDALIKIGAPFIATPDHVVASGGTVRIANGSKVQFGRVESVALPENPLVLMQVIEYTRAFLCGRVGWNSINSTMVISGAFGLFSKKVVMEAGGYTPKCIGEDMELIIRLHEYCRRTKRDYSIVFVPDPVCWTEAPGDLKSLGLQRDRWARGLADTLSRHKRMLFNYRYGLVGTFAMPYFLLVELLGPVFEIASILLIILSFFFGGFDGQLLWTFLMASVLYGAALSLASVLLEEIYFSKYNNIRQMTTLFFYCLLESLWFRPLSTFWRLRGLVKFIKGDHGWGQLQRVGFGPKS